MADNGKNIKLAICGPGGVGKSCLTTQYIHNKFLETYDPTIEDSYKKTVILSGGSYNLEVVDTAGQEEFAAMRETYMKDAQGFLLVYSVNDERSVDALEDFFTQIYRVHEDKEFPPPVVVVGNKCDLDRRVELAHAKSQMQKFNKGKEVQVLEVSAKTKVNVEQSFEAVCYEVIKQRGGSGGGDGGKGKGKSKDSSAGGGKKKGGCVLA